MTAVGWLRRMRLRLALLGVTRALVWAGTVLFAGLAVATFVAQFELRFAAAAAALGTLATLLWRERFVWSLSRVALWLEERLPELRYAAVTAIDPRYAAALGPRVGMLLRRVETLPVMRRAAVRSVLVPVVALALAAAAFAVVPARSPGAQPNALTAAADGDEPASRLEPLTATLTPPSYAVEAGGEAQTLDEPTTISGLAGSTVSVMGPGSPDGLGVRLADSVLVAAAAPHDAEPDTEDADVPGQRAGWHVTFTMPDSAAALRFEDREHRRSIVLAPVRDRPPVVQLILPAQDTTVREPTGSLTLDAQLTDDVGLAETKVEYIVASGDFEGTFTHREGEIGARAFDRPGLRRTRLELNVPLSTFELEPGDLLSVRAVAIDNNDWSGPGIGYSEPRTLRVARPGEYDSLAVEPAPPPADSALMTLRWLIELVERLDNSRDELPRPVFVDSSRGFGARAERLRVRVQQIQNDLTMGGMFEPNPLLNTAYLALVQGESALKIAEPGESLPHLWEALEALEEYAKAERYYLRGIGPDVLVDLARVRLTGEDEGQAAGARTPRGLADTTRLRLRAAYTDALALLDTAPDSASERLALIQVEALRVEPPLAVALGAAVGALHAGRDPAPALKLARQILDGPVAAADTLPAWSGAW